VPGNAHDIEENPLKFDPAIRYSTMMRYPVKKKKVRTKNRKRNPLIEHTTKRCPPRKYPNQKTLTAKQHTSPHQVEIRLCAAKHETEKTSRLFGGGRVFGDSLV
jgi:hypothetical protein